MDDRRERIQSILKILHKLYPDAKTELNFSNPWELLVAVQLSAQCTDKLVNKVTEQLFQKYPMLPDYLRADLTNFDKDISSVTFHSNKAKNILASAKMIEEKFSGEVPQTMEELLTLPGVARKTANVVLYNAFNKNEGMAIDTHMIRLSQKLGLTTQTDPKKIELELMELVPKEEWGFFSNALILYGRRICNAREHDCSTHDLTLIYPQAATIWPKK